MLGFYHNQSKQVYTSFGFSRRSTAIELERARQVAVGQGNSRPNVYVFLFDSTSREQFHRQAPAFLKALHQKVAAANATVIEFERYSTIGTLCFVLGALLRPGAHSFAIFWQAGARGRIRKFSIEGAALSPGAPGHISAIPATPR